MVLVSWSLLASILGSSTAWAHVPHEVLLGAAIPSSSTVDQPWIVALFDEDAVGLYRSTDFGETFQASGGAPMQDEITGGAYTRDGRAVLMGDGRYWYTDDGETWSSADVPFTVATDWAPIAGGDQIYFAAEDGIWAATPGEDPTHMLTGTPMASVFGGAAGPTALSTDGGVYHFASNRWPRIEPPPDEVLYSATATSTDVYVGTAAGNIYRWDGTVWNMCAPAPYAAESGPHPEVTRLASEGARVYGVRAKLGMFWSSDGCRTWGASIAPLTNYFEEDPGDSFTTSAKAFTFVNVSGDRVVTGGYDGAAVLGDAGAWSHPQLIGGDYTRGVAWSNDFNADGQLLLAAYGSGVARSLDGGATFSAPGIGVHDANVQTVYVPDNVPGMDLAYGTFNRVLYRTYDQGGTWEEITGPFDYFRQFILGPGDRMWGSDVQRDPRPPNGVLFSGDAGGSWQELSGFPSSFADDTVFGVYDSGGLICVNTMEHLACSTDDRASWVDAYAVAESGDRIHDLVGWPRSSPDRVLVADSKGVFKLDGHGGSVQVWDSGTASVRRLAVADDGTVFAGDEAGRLLRSDDGGDTWADMGVDFPCQIKTIVPRPDYATWGEIIVGGMDGTFLVDASGTRRFAAYQRVDDVTEYVRCAGCDVVEDAEAAIGQYRVVSSLKLYLANLRGHTFRVRGRSDGTQMGQVIVDDAVVWSDIVPATDGFESMIEVSGFTDGWHTVSFSVISEGSVDVDGLEAIGDSDPLPGTFDGVVDSDGDGYDSTQDCDDGDATAYPGAPETPDDGIDQDCDGVDEVTGDTGDSGDSGDSGDTGAGGSDTGDGKDTGCGCASGPTSGSLAGVAMVAALLGARRRDRTG